MKKESENNVGEEEVQIEQNFSPAIIYQQDKAVVDMQIATAKAYPRNVLKATNNAIAIINLDEKIAETCNYTVPRAGNNISGPSVHLAKIVVQQWGNMRIEAKVVDVDQTHVTSEAICWDLETNLAIKVQVKRSIVGKRGRFSEDMVTVTGNAANAISLRNAIFHVVPKGVIDKVYKSALRKITGDVSDKTKLITRRKEVIDALKDSFSVSEKEILSALGKASVELINVEDIATLVGIGNALRDGDTTVDEAFRNGRDKPTTLEDIVLLVDMKKETLTPDELKNAQRIIDNKEEKSYTKLSKILQSK